MGGKGGKATPPVKEKVDHTKCDITPGQDTVIEIIKVGVFFLFSPCRPFLPQVVNHSVQSIT